MIRTPARTTRRWLATVVAGATLVGLTAGPAAAKGAKLELSKRVTVTGTQLKSSSDIGSTADPAIGMPAPTITGQGYNGKTVTFANDGKPRLLLFFAHWCPHCQRTVPKLVKLAKSHAFAGVEVDTVTTNTNKDYPNYPPSAWLARVHWPFGPVMADDDHARALLAFGGDAFPYFVFVDAGGKIQARASGELSPSTVAGALKRLAAGQPVINAS
jgi:thiol-disulfide isomerase/thioredoxin